MKKKSLAITGILILFLLIPLSFSLACTGASVPQLPHKFSGKILTSGASNASSSNLLTATLESNEFTIYTDANGSYGMSSPFLVEKCGTSADNTITFKFQGQSLSGTQTFSAGQATEYNITLTAGIYMCGDGTCNGGEVCGTTNIYTACNRDCGECTTTTPSSGGTTTPAAGVQGGTGGAPAGGAGGKEEEEMETLTATNDEETEVSYSRSLDVDTENGRSTVNIQIRNDNSYTLKNFEYRERIPETVATDPSQLSFSIQPTRFEKGSIIAVWLFEKLEPKETIAISYTVDKVIKSLSNFSAGIVSLEPKEAGAAEAKKVSMEAPKNAKAGDIVAITLAYENGTAAGGIAVKVTTPLNKVLSLTTDAQGKASYTATEAGTYSYSVGKGYVLAVGKSTTVSEASKPAAPPSGAPKAEGAAPSEAKEAEGGLFGLELFATIVLGAVILVVIVGAYVLLKGKKKRL